MLITLETLYCLRTIVSSFEENGPLLIEKQEYIFRWTANLALLRKSARALFRRAKKVEKLLVSTHVSDSIVAYCFALDSSEIQQIRRATSWMKAVHHYFK
ncbi:hypothetical protein J6590_011810 [Homalodisca vitripennis]|nr:hypothetical protein J6590_098321 [Homalodisca vitripennis]KAG8259515.1 hypothetical protein J6590_011810 [Homalodisca vitripennis]